MKCPQSKFTSCQVMRRPADAANPALRRLRQPSATPSSPPPGNRFGGCPLARKISRSPGCQLVGKWRVPLTATLLAAIPMAGGLILGNARRQFQELFAREQAGHSEGIKDLRCPA